ncbi:T9SS type A sorting domain-containing protein [bacterium]|nr:T9SS type A sorting domain-containing protein [bacterium]
MRSIKHFGDSLMYCGSEILDVTNPHAPDSIGTLWGLGGIDAISDEFFINLDDDSVQLFSVEDPVHPELITKYFPYEALQTAKLWGKYLLVVGKWGLRIVDISNPSQPEQIGYLQIQTTGRIAVNSEAAYIELSPNRLGVVDLRNPYAPVLTDSLNRWDWGVPSPLSMDVVHDYLVCCDSPHGRNNPYFLNLSDPYHPGDPEVYAGMEGRLLCFSGDVAYSIDPDQTNLVEIYSFVNPETPFIVDEFTLPEPLVKYHPYDSFHFMENKMFIPANAPGDYDNIYTLAYNIQDPFNPALIGALEGDSRFRLFQDDLMITDNYPDHCIEVVDIRNLDQTFTRGYFQPADDPYLIYLSYQKRNNYIYALSEFFLDVYDISAALEVLDESRITTLPLNFELESPYPNPFNSTVTVPFKLNQPSTVRFTVRNILGRIILEGKQQGLEGHNRLQILQGAEIIPATGIYTFEIEAGDTRQIVRAVHVK